MPQWGPGEVELLKRLWADVSITTTQIGQRFGTTKDAVIGKAHRLKLPHREYYRSSGFPIPPVEIPPVESGRFCRWRLWGLGEQRSCGKPALAGSDYCIEHFERVRVVKRY
jgi:GcrA cell cycle regulator